MKVIHFINDDGDGPYLATADDLALSDVADEWAGQLDPCSALPSGRGSEICAREYGAGRAGNGYMGGPAGVGGRSEARAGLEWRKRTSWGCH